MKMRLERSERWPDYCLLPKAPYGLNIEGSEEFLAEYRQVTTAYDDFQSRLDMLYKGARK